MGMNSVDFASVHDHVNVEFTCRRVATRAERNRSANIKRRSFTALEEVSAVAGRWRVVRRVSVRRGSARHRPYAHVRAASQSCPAEFLSQRAESSCRRCSARSSVPGPESLEGLCDLASSKIADMTSLFVGFRSGGGGDRPDRRMSDLFRPIRGYSEFRTDSGRIYIYANF
jgi:hypothetical protein